MSCYLDYENENDYLVIFSKLAVKYWPDGKLVANKLDRALSEYVNRGNRVTTEEILDKFWSRKREKREVDVDVVANTLP